jgi:hypothetical protein
MTDAERLTLLLEVANAERWMEGDNPDAAALRSEVERVPLSRQQLMRRLRAFISSETRIGVGRVGMKAREWTPRVRIAGLRHDLTDREIEALRLEELRFVLGMMLRGEGVLPLAISVGVSKGEESVSGQFPDVVLYLAMRLLAASGLTIGTCEAPEAGDPGYPNAFDRACGGVLISKRGGKRRRRYCSDACEQRAKNPKWKKRRRT